MMKRTYVLTIITGLISFLCAALPVAAENPDYHKILATIDEQSNFTNTDFSTLLNIIRKDPDEGTKVMKVSSFRRDSEDKFVMLTLEPQAEKGQGYLMIDSNLWFYDPESRKFSHTSMKESFSNTDANNSDFRRSSRSTDYAVTSGTEGTLGKYDVYVLELQANNNEVAYPHLKMWIQKENDLVLKVEDYSLNDRILRTEYYPSYVKLDGRYLPSRMIFVDALTPGKQTDISLSDMSLAKLPDSVFTKAFIERASR